MWLTHKLLHLIKRKPIRQNLRNFTNKRNLIMLSTKTLSRIAVQQFGTNYNLGQKLWRELVILDKFILFHH